MKDSTRHAMQLALDIVYDDLRSCIECCCVMSSNGPGTGTMIADDRDGWFAHVM